MIKPKWLPEMFEVSPWKNDSFERLYKIFSNDYLSCKLRYQNFPVSIIRDKEDAKEKVFWHLVAREDKVTKNRLPDFRRAERLPWGRPMFENIGNEEILNWDYEEGDGDIHTYLWLKNFDYIIILKKFKNGSRRLITAFWVEYENYKNKLMKKYRDKLMG